MSLQKIFPLHVQSFSRAVNLSFHKGKHFFLSSILSKNRLKDLMAFSAITLLHSSVRCGVVEMFSTFRSSFVIFAIRQYFRDNTDARTFLVLVGF